MIAPDEIPQDANLLRCTVKKSWSMTKHLILYVSYIIDGIAAVILAFFGIVGIWQALSPIAEWLWCALTGALFAVPWWCYVIVLGLATIPVYSALWCMARNLTDEDWQSEQAKKFLEDALAALAALAFAALANPGDCKALLFIGAYLHYRERMRNDILQRARNYPNK